MKENSVELLAPAGSVDSLKAAVAAGADAVYIGGSRFGARAYADNPDEEQLVEAIDYAHLHGCRLYLTVNTLVKEQELDELEEYVRPYYAAGADGVIVQDLGVCSLIRERFPDLPIHASTQMTITSAYGAKLLKDMGVSRVVAARELSLSEIREIHEKVDIEIESFVHGALCYCYSGQCLMSSLIGGRSGNRGRCAQPCRLPYEVRCDGKPLERRMSKENRTKGGYALSMKDLSTLDILPDIIEAGVSSLKIEGRMKSARYTAGVVSIYRNYVDRYLKDRNRAQYHVDAADRRRLLDLFDRGGQTEGYYHRHNGRDMVVWKEKPTFKETNNEYFAELDRRFLEKERQEPVDGHAWFQSGKPARLTLFCRGCEATVTGAIVEKARNHPSNREQAARQLKKTGNTPFVMETLSVEMEDGVFLPVQMLNDLRRRGLTGLQAMIQGRFKRPDPEKKGRMKRACLPGPSGQRDVTGREPASGRRVSGGQDANSSIQPFFCVSLERPDTFFAALSCRDVTRLYLDAAYFSPDFWKEAVISCHKTGKECMLALPQIFRAEAEHFFDHHRDHLADAGFDGVLARSLEEIAYLRTRHPSVLMVSDFNLYAMNSRAQAVLKSLGVSELVWPVECNSRELGGLDLSGELLIYGRLPMMTTAQCVHQGMGRCDKKPGTLWLRDRVGKEFPVRNHCVFCYNTVYNAEPLSLLGLEAEVERLAPSALRLQFTTESAEETREILECFADRFLRHGDKQLPLKEFTRGHFKRGVM